MIVKERGELKNIAGKGKIGPKSKIICKCKGGSFNI